MEERRVILDSEAMDAVHLGVYNLNVVRHVDLLLDGVECSRPLQLENDGDMIALVREMIERGSGDTVRIKEVKGHADENMVQVGRVRELARLENNTADEAADMGH